MCKGGSTKWCNRCAEVVYCTPDCQVEDWVGHKFGCRELSRVKLKSWIWENGDKPGYNTGLDSGYGEGNGDLGYGSGDCSYDQDRGY